MKNKEKITETLYLIGVSILSIYICLSPSLIVTISSNMAIVLELIIVLCFLVKLCSQTYTIKQVICMVCLGMLVAYTTYVTQNRKILCSYLALISMKNVDVRKIVKVIFYSSTIIVLLESIYYIYCLKFDYSKITKIYINQKGQVRHTLFIGHPNVAAQSILWVITMYVYLNIDKKNVAFLVAVIVCSMSVTDYFTLSRTTLLAFLILIIFTIFIKMNTKKINKFLQNFSKNIFIVCMLITFISVYWYYKSPSSEMLSKLDELLSWRLTCSTMAYKYYNFTLLGQLVNYNINVSFRNISFETLMLDNVYIKVLFNYGAVYLLIFLILIIKNVNKCNRKDWIFFILFAIVGVSENMVFYPTRSLMLFFIIEKCFLDTKVYSDNKKIKGE